MIVLRSTARRRERECLRLLPKAPQRGKKAAAKVARRGGAALSSPALFDF